MSASGKPVIAQDQIKMMMENAQRMIQERKKSLGTLSSSGSSRTRFEERSVAPSLASAAAASASASRGGQNQEKVQKIADLQAQIASKLSALPARPPSSSAVTAASAAAAAQSAAAAVTAAPDRPHQLILDASGRCVDAAGNQVTIAPQAPTLKANIRARRRDEFTQQLQQQRVSSTGGGGAAGGESGDSGDQRFFDPRLAASSRGRGRGGRGRGTSGGLAFNFHQPGKFQQLASRLRAKAQLERLQTEIASISQRTGISSAVKLAMVAPRGGENRQQADSAVPDVEWWDRVVLGDSGYGGVAPLSESRTNGSQQSANSHYQGITNLVEHPCQLKPPIEKEQKFLPLLLTKRERKKLRRTNRREAWKDKQEKIRLGLEPAPEPKVRMSNLMRVLGNEAIQDPTKVEAHVRAQMAKRLKVHEDTNAARRLTDEQRKQKRINKLREDTSQQVHVAIYRLKDLSNPAKKFKVETNAKQLFMTGTVVLFKDVNVVVVEGGPKQQKKYKQLMMNRIKWDEDVVKCKDGSEIDNKCSLVWEGTTKQRSFGEIRFKLCPTETFARDHFRKHSSEQYWDLAYSSTVLEADQAAL